VDSKATMNSEEGGVDSPMEGEGAAVDESRRCEGWSNEERVDVEADGGGGLCMCMCKYSTVRMQATSRRAKTLIEQICYTRKTPIWRASGFWYNMRQFEHGSNLASVFG